MKRIFDMIRTAAILMVLSMSASCLKVDILKPVMEDSQVSLTLKCSDIAQTRATEPGEDDYNENDINTLDIFFYPSTADVNTVAIHHMRLENLQGTGSYTYNQRIETSVIETIFGTSGTTAKIYAIANFKSDDNSVTLSSTATVNQLKSTVIATAAFAGTVAQDDFVMDSVGDSADDDALIDDEVTYDSNTRSISGTINLYRAASKIGLFITSVTDVPVTDANGNPVLDDAGNPVMWVAKTDGMLVRLNNGVKKTKLDADYTVETADYFSFAASKERKMQKPEGKSAWQQDIPFYSYPSNWSERGSDKEAYLTLIVPWVKSNDPNKPYPTYYQVPVNGLTQQLSRNSYYKINLEVSRLGKFTEEESVKITPGSYLILDWTTNTIDADMLDYRYLVVDQKEYTIYNQNELYIPFASSHTAEITNITFAQQNIKGTSPTWTTIGTSSSNRYNALTIVGNQVYYRNTLDNVYTSDTFDFTPYRLTFRIKHTGTAGDTYYEDITVYQYPAIYGTPETNSGYSSSNSTIKNNGYTFVNGYTGGGSSSLDFFGTVPGISGSPNRYVFTITSVEGTNFKIGDPRENTVRYDENDARWKSANVLENGVVNMNTSRELKYYYGTEVSDNYNATSTTSIYSSDAQADQSERTVNMVAPKFRIASGYAVLAHQDSEMEIYENLRKRCASYQEDGYPAGRWRLPTRAEFQFIVSLVNKGLLPEVYKVGYSYWCAHGVGSPQSDGTVKMYYVTEGRYNNGDGHSTRCVYDEWYWKDKLSDEDKDTFTWGDMPR